MAGGGGGGRYALSFMCWLDVLACLSLLPSVVYAFGFGANGSGGAGSMLHMLRGGRAATTGARLARFVRVLHFANRSHPDQHPPHTLHTEPKARLRPPAQRKRGGGRSGAGGGD